MGDGKWEEGYREDLGRDTYDCIREGWCLGQDGGGKPRVR